MHQGHLFDEPQSDARREQPELEGIPGSELRLYPDFWSPEEADSLLKALWEQTGWKQETVVVFGKSHPSPRLSAWHGDPGAVYTYSGIRNLPKPWNAPLSTIKQRLEPFLGTSFNSVLVNAYRNGQDAMGWHADDEASLGERPVIASVSFGATRKFVLKPRPHSGINHDPVAIWLEHGSLLVMSGSTQRNWHHGVPRTKQVEKLRINLTFRWVEQR